MENNQRNSRKRLNSLILLVAFTAIMLIVSTYAWFSTQRNVTLTGLKGAVNVAEGLQMSLDAKHWFNSLNFEDFEEEADTGAWKLKTSANQILDANKTFQNPAEGITNITPKEYLPVSTTGNTNEGIGLTKLNMYNGVYDSAGLKNIALANEEAASGYFAFDVYLQNTTSTSATQEIDKLQLESNSKVTGVNAATGIQNTVRVAIALYENSGDEMDVNTLSSVESDTEKQSKIIAGTSTDKKIKDVAIWEPNADKHVSTITSNITLKLEDADKGTLTNKNAQGRYIFADGDMLPTYAVTIGTKTAATVSDVYDWTTATTTTTKLEKQITTQTKQTDESWVEPIDLKSVKDGSTAIGMVKNQYQKVRIYVWIEGQDPDCINYASMGKGLTLDIGLSKPESTFASGT